MCPLVVETIYFQQPCQKISTFYFSKLRVATSCCVLNMHIKGAVSGKGGQKIFNRFPLSTFRIRLALGSPRSAPELSGFKCQRIAHDIDQEIEHLFPAS